MNRLTNLRLARVLIFAVLLIGVGVAAAQDTFPTLPPVDTPMPQLEILTPLPPPPETTPGAPEQPAEQPPSTLGVEQAEALPGLIAARADLELLATVAIGSEQRPVGWSGSIDVTDPQLPLWIRLDLETLAGMVMGEDQRPPGWFGVVPSIPLAVTRDIRHDLELLADVVIGAQGIRPAGWNGDDPMMRCSRATQSLFTLLQNRGLTFDIDFTQPDYCNAAELAASLYVERNILQPPAQAAAAAGRYPYQTENAFAVAFLDRAARHKIGVLPVGTGFEPLGRSSFEFSNMMLVRGDNFQVFVDYTTTPITGDQFLSLPEIGSAETTDCQADWCGKGLD